MKTYLQLKQNFDTPLGPQFKFYLPIVLTKFTQITFKVVAFHSKYKEKSPGVSSLATLSTKNRSLSGLSATSPLQKERE